MKRKLKQVICVLLGTMLFCTARVGAYTECETEYSGEISPQYEEIVSIFASISIDESGLASCQCTASTDPADRTIKLKMELQQMQSSGWETIKTWSVTGISPRTLRKSYVVKSGYNYKVCATVTVLDKYGNEIEQGTHFSNIEFY